MMTDHQFPPPPLEWHPFYRDHTDLLDWLEGRGPASEGVQFAQFHAAKIEDYPPDEQPRRLILVKRKAWGPAPYVGRPFRYVWYCASDHLGRWISGEARIHYLPEEPWQ